MVLCGGLGTRLSSVISDKPKPLAPIAGKSFLDYVIDWLVSSGHKDIILSMYHKADQIKSHLGKDKRADVTYRFVVEDKPMGTGGALLKAREFIAHDEDFLLVNGDTFFNINLNAFYLFHKARKPILSIALSNVLDVRRYSCIEIDKNFKIKSYAEKLYGDREDPVAGLVSGGVYLINKGIFEFLKGKRAPFSLEADIIPKVVKAGKARGYLSDKTHYDIGTPSGYRKTAAYLKGENDIVIKGRAPLRVAFGGGGSDVPPFDKKIGGLVLNATINRYVYGSLTVREDRKVRIISSDYKKTYLYDDVTNLFFDGEMDLIKAIIKRMDINYGFELYLRSDVPPNSGLGSSASLSVLVIGLFNHLSVERKLNKHEIAELAFISETEDLKNPGGRQDQYASVFGGLNFFEFKGNDFVKVNPLNLDKETVMELEKSILIVYVGKREASGNIHKSMSLKVSEKVAYLSEIKNLCHESYIALLNKDLLSLGNLIGEAWNIKKRFYEGGMSDYIDALYSEAIKNGALGGRVLGAGGGGHMVFLCSPNSESRVAEALESMGARVLDFSFEFDGLQTWE